MEYEEPSDDYSVEPIVEQSLEKDQCQQVTLTQRNEKLAKIAVELHLLGNDGSNQRYEDGRSYRKRARQGYRAELAVAQHYNLIPEIDYRPPKIGDSGRDLLAWYENELLSIDVKGTATDPPKLYLTRKRESSSKYTLPDCYILVSHKLRSGKDLDIVGWCTAEEIMNGREKTKHGNPVWVLNGQELNSLPQKQEFSQPSQREQLEHELNRI